MGQGRKRDPVMGLFLTLAAWPVLVVIFVVPLGYILLSRAAQNLYGDEWLALELAIALAYCAGSFCAGALSGVLAAKAETWFMLTLLINLALLAASGGKLIIASSASLLIPAMLTLSALAAPALGRFAYERLCRQKNEQENPGDASSSGE